MLKHSEFNAEHKKGLSKMSLKNLFLLKAFAESEDGGDDKGDEGAKKDPINFEQLIASARKEEKDKLYPRIKKLEDENKEMIKNSNEYLVKIGTLQKEIDELKSKKGDNEEITKLKGQITTLEEENKTLKESTPKEEEIRSQIEKEYAVKLYRTEQINAHKEEILSVFENDIKGSTNEEIDKAITAVKEKTLEIKKALGLDPDKKDDKKKDDKKETKPEKQPKAPLANPAMEDEDGFDADYVRNLDPHSPEYAEWRKKMGLK